jgi:hypothetical protein
MLEEMYMFASAPDCGGRYGKHPDLYLILQSQKNTRILVLKNCTTGYPLSIQKRPLEFFNHFPSYLINRKIYKSLAMVTLFYAKFIFFSSLCPDPDLFEIAT